MIVAHYGCMTQLDPGTVRFVKQHGATAWEGDPDEADPNQMKAKKLELAPLEITVTSEEILADLLYPPAGVREPRT